MTAASINLEVSMDAAEPERLGYPDQDPSSMGGPRDPTSGSASSAETNAEVVADMEDNLELLRIKMRMLNRKKASRSFTPEEYAMMQEVISDIASLEKKLDASKAQHPAPARGESSLDVQTDKPGVKTEHQHPFMRNTKWHGQADLESPGQHDRYDLTITDAEDVELSGTTSPHIKSGLDHAQKETLDPQRPSIYDHTRGLKRQKASDSSDTADSSDTGEGRSSKRLATGEGGSPLSAENNANPQSHVAIELATKLGETAAKGTETSPSSARTSEAPQAGSSKEHEEQQKAISRAIRNFGRTKISAVGGGWRLEGMKTAMMYHQLDGASWMRTRENAKAPPAGGILADAMGLGKTLELLALVVGHPPKGKHGGHDNNTTLVVVPNRQVMDHWMEQIARHCKDIKTCTFRRGDPPQDGALANFKIVLATYSDFRRTPSKPGTFLEGACDIFKFPFYRIILDECHEIKNHLSRTAKEICRLEAKFRWCCSATLIPNGAQQLYSYMKFLRVIDSDTMRNWNKAYGIAKGKGSKSFKNLVTKVLLRREETTTFLGKPVLDLPAKTIMEPRIAILSNEEECIYSLIKKEYRSILNEQLKDASDDERRKLLNSRITRLRQASTHVFLLESLMREDFTLERICHLRQELQEMKPQTQLLGGLQNVCAHIETEKKAPTAAGDSRTNTRIQKFDIDPQLKMPQRVKEKIEKACPVCGHEPSTDAVKAKSTSSGKGINKPSRKRGDDFLGVQPSSVSEFLDLHDKSSSTSLLLSSKTAALRDLVQEWQASAPNYKIIIFTQWITMGRIIARMIEDEGLEYVYLFGELDIHRRRKATDAFRNEPKVKVMVCSLKCGGQSLDLTCASRVILVDLWWNLDTENQAFARVFRPGQAKETYFARVVVKDSVDEHIEKIQTEKGLETGEMLRDQDRTLPKLGIHELASLFGTVREDANGRLTILSDEDGEDEHNGGEDGDAESDEGSSTGKEG